MTKKRYNVSIEPAVWELAKRKISEPLSCFIQKQLEIACKLDNRKAEIEKELHEKEREVIALRSQLCKLEQEDKARRENKENYKKCLPTIERIHGVKNKIGKNQIEDVAGAHKLDKLELIKLCESEGFNIVELLEFDNDTNKKHGGCIR